MSVDESAVSALTMSLEGMLHLIDDVCSMSSLGDDSTICECFKILASLDG